MNPQNETTAEIAGFFVAVSIELGWPGIPGMPAGNVEGLMILHRCISHRLAGADLLLMPVGTAGELNDAIILCQVRHLAASVAIIKDTLEPVLVRFVRIAWFDFREDFYRPVFPGPDEFRSAALIDKARLASLQGRHREILHLSAKP